MIITAFYIFHFLFQHFFLEIDLISNRSFEKNFVDLTGEASVFVLKYEVSNASYKLFLNEIGAKDLFIFDVAKYDSTLFKEKIPLLYETIFHSKYHSHLAYANFPIVNISLEGAKEYCKWLTGYYNHLLRRKYKEVIFRLPKDEEAGLLLNKAGGKHIPDIAEREHKKYFANLAYWADEEKRGRNMPCDGGFYMVNISNYKQHTNGLRSVIGNVAEMTASGNIYGGSYDDIYSEISKKKYIPPDPRVGFRIVMEVINR